VKVSQNDPFFATGIVLGLLGLLFGLPAYRRSGRTAAAPATAAGSTSEPVSASRSN
jgi:hypothetical protein